jgi:hypothetical protein
MPESEEQRKIWNAAFEAANEALGPMWDIEFKERAARRSAFMVMVLCEKVEQLQKEAADADE